MPPKDPENRRRIARESQGRRRARDKAARQLVLADAPAGSNNNNNKNSAVPPPEPPITMHEFLATAPKNPLVKATKRYQHMLEKVTAREVEEAMITFAGPPGIGKSKLAEMTFDALGWQQYADWDFIAAASNDDLLDAMWFAEQARYKAIVFDDYNKIARGLIIRDIIKGAYGEKRTVRYKSATMSKLDPPRPDDFPVTTILVYLTNVSGLERDDDIRAIFDRGVYFNPKPTDTQLFRFIMWKVLTQPEFTANYQHAAKIEAVQWFNRERNNVQTLSLRTMVKALKYVNNTLSSPIKTLEASLLALTEPARPYIPGFEPEEIEFALNLQLQRRGLPKPE